MCWPTTPSAWWLLALGLLLAVIIGSVELPGELPDGATAPTPTVACPPIAPCPPRDAAGRRLPPDPAGANR
jgi:hypothetical protein